MLVSAVATVAYSCVSAPFSEVDSRESLVIAVVVQFPLIMGKRDRLTHLTC